MSFSLNKQLSLADYTTRRLETRGEIPPPLSGASITMVKDHIYVFGGRTASRCSMTNDLYSNNRYLVVFGGIGYRSAPQILSDRLCTLNDIHMFDTETCAWVLLNEVETSSLPLPRYAHLSMCENNILIIIGGQTIENQYIYDINLFDLSTHTWIQKNALDTSYGTYRAAALCLPVEDISMQKSILYPPEKRPKNSSLLLDTIPPLLKEEKNKQLAVCVYSNYNFSNITRDLQIIYPFQGESQAKSYNRSSLMGRQELPPGLRFPTGRVIGHHFILTGTYLASTHNAFHIWALDLVTLVWKQIDGGSALSIGSWNYGFLSEMKNKVFVLGHRDKNLLEDYQERRVNYNHLVVVDLESYGIYLPPRLKHSVAVHDIYLQVLADASLANLDVVTKDGCYIPANSAILANRWPLCEKLVVHPSSRISRRTIIQFPENYDVAIAFLQFIYTGRLLTVQQNQPHVLTKLLLLSDMLNVPCLKEVAVYSLHQNLTLTTARTIYETAILTSEIALQIRALRVMINAKKVLHQTQHHTNAMLDSEHMSSQSSCSDSFSLTLSLSKYSEYSALQSPSPFTNFSSRDSISASLPSSPCTYTMHPTPH
ncbi:hypothetical protein BDF14DRAFT_1850341 [Spinellus fusiger]|nr:hypothetical protein BDF14DRAFT_1850341 [Spinellus fusiger]